jgi:hypothetical protein
MLTVKKTKKQHTKMVKTGEVLNILFSRAENVLCKKVKLFCWYHWRSTQAQAIVEIIMSREKKKSALICGKA